MHLRDGTGRSLVVVVVSAGSNNIPFFFCVASVAKKFLRGAAFYGKGAFYSRCFAQVHLRRSFFEKLLSTERRFLFIYFTKSPRCLFGRRGAVSPSQSHEGTKKQTQPSAHRTEPTLMLLQLFQLKMPLLHSRCTVCRINNPVCA